jgi:hypothetical protein
MTATASVRPDLESMPPGTAGSDSTPLPDILGVAPDLFAARTVAGTLHGVVGLARRTFGCDAAGVVLTADHAGVTATAATAEDARRADALQLQHHQGPALDAITEWRPVLSAELRADSRWRFWAPQAADLGFRSVLSMVLADNGPFGALTLYSRHPSFFRTGFLLPGFGFGQQASIAIVVAVEREQLLRARDSREIIGQAQGILMERYQITADQAFAVLRRYSSHRNQKLRLIAERMVNDRVLPELDLSGLPCQVRPTV